MQVSTYRDTYEFTHTYVSKFPIMKLISLGV